MNESGQLMDVHTLSDKLGKPNLRIVDCRFNLQQPKEGRFHYLQGHLPGAVYANLDNDLSAPVGVTTGRHPLPRVETLCEKLGDWGVDNDTCLLAYDRQNGAIAARLWWMLRWLGHQKVFLLNGGFNAWEQHGYPVESGVVSYRKRKFAATPKPAMVVTTAEIVAALQRDTMPLLVDAREAERFAGISEPIDAVAGHIPGAVNFPLENSLDSNGCWLTSKELHGRWRPIIGRRPKYGWIAMCGSGVTACHLAFSAQHAGFAAPRVYIGSWSEWIRDMAPPVKK